jgi:hypothetical protein
MALIRIDTPVLDADSPNANVKGILKAGQTWFVTTPDSSGAYFQVFVNGPNLGWVRAADIQLLGPLPGSPATPNPVINPPPANNAIIPPIKAPFDRAVVQTNPGNALSVAANNAINAPILPNDQSSLIPFPVASLPGVVTIYNLALRNAPGTDSAQVGMARQGEVYTVSGQSPSGTWLHVSGPAGTGWMDAAFVRVIGPRASLPVMR